MFEWLYQADFTVLDGLQGSPVPDRNVLYGPDSCEPRHSMRQGRRVAAAIVSTPSVPVICVLCSATSNTEDGQR
jgi:hypothetical protein